MNEAIKALTKDKDLAIALEAIRDILYNKGLVEAFQVLQGYFDSLEAEYGTLYRYAWKNNEKRATMHNRVCFVVARGKMNSALIEFIDNGQREVVSRNALRRLRKGTKNQYTR